MRCSWVLNDPLYIKYHDEEWGHTQYDSERLFEMLCLSGQQAGLSWKVILNKRENYRKAFYNFNPYAVSQMSKDDIEKLMKNNGILRNRAKINSIINNARALLRLEEEGPTFSQFIWSFVNYAPIINDWTSNDKIPTQSNASFSMGKALKNRGFTFVGSTICYAYMQSCGLINDHITNCCAKNI